jgi:hypothetical protein
MAEQVSPEIHYSEVFVRVNDPDEVWDLYMDNKSRAIEADFGNQPSAGEVAREVNLGVKLLIPNTGLDDFRAQMIDVGGGLWDVDVVDEYSIGAPKPRIAFELPAGPVPGARVEG